MSDEDDRRSESRVGFKVPAHVLLGPTQALQKGHILNLSESGALLMMPKSVQLGPNVAMRFMVPPNTICEATGNIVRIDDMGLYQGVGMSFPNANPAYAIFLRNLSAATNEQVSYFVRDMGRIKIWIW